MNGKKLNIDIFKIENKNSSGSTADVYKYNNFALKLYDDPINYSIKQDLFNELSSIKNKNFIELYETFKTDIDGSLVEGYISKYYIDEKINPLKLESSYMLKNIEYLKELRDIFTNKKIVMRDLHPWNSIYTKDGIVLIDPDDYRVVNLDIDVINMENKNILVDFTINTLKRYSDDKLCNIDYLEEYGTIKYLDDLKKEKNPDNALEVIEENLKKAKRPIDFIRKLK